MLKYPSDRYNKFVLLSYYKNGETIFYVPDFERAYDAGSDAANALKYSGACLVLSKRLQEIL